MHTKSAVRQHASLARNDWFTCLLIALASTQRSTILRDYDAFPFSGKFQCRCGEGCFLIEMIYSFLPTKLFDILTLTVCAGAPPSRNETEDVYCATIPLGSFYKERDAADFWVNETILGLDWFRRLVHLASLQYPQRRMIVSMAPCRLYSSFNQATQFRHHLSFRLSLYLFGCHWSWWGYSMTLFFPLQVFKLPSSRLVDSKETTSVSSSSCSKFLFSIQAASKNHRMYRFSFAASSCITPRITLPSSFLSTPPLFRGFFEAAEKYRKSSTDRSDESGVLIQNYLVNIMQHG